MNDGPVEDRQSSGTTEAIITESNVKEVQETTPGTETKSRGDSAFVCHCWRSSNDRSASAFSAPCASPNCVYAYINSGHPSFEQFKIQLGNVNKFATIKVVKALLKSLGLESSKIKPVARGFFFIAFRSAEDRDQAIEKLNGYIFKGRPLEARVTRPAADPIMLKRAQRAQNPSDDKQGGKEEGENAHEDHLPKKRRTVNDGDEADYATPETATDQNGQCLLHQLAIEANSPIGSVAPLYKMPYDPDQLKVKQASAFECLRKVRNSVKKLNKARYCDDCLQSGFFSFLHRKMQDADCPITPSPITEGYRNKSKFTIGHGESGKGPVIGVRVGRYTAGSTAVADAISAPIFSASTISAIRSLRKCLEAVVTEAPPTKAPLGDVIAQGALERIVGRIKIFDLVSRTGNLLAVTVRESRLYDLLVELEIHRGDLTDEDVADLETILKFWFSSGGPGEAVGVTSLYLTVLKGVSMVPGTFSERCVLGKETITELCCGLKFEIAKDAFFQVNTLATEKLYEEIKRRCRCLLEAADKSRDDAILLDVCCGTGTIGLCLANCFSKVYGIELVPSAIENAKVNAMVNNITNAVFMAGKAEVLLKDLMKTLPTNKEIFVVLDPPRAGVHNGVIEAIRRCERISHVIFVACDLSRAVHNFEAFARPPSKRYTGWPFLPMNACCVDLFPHTPGVEIVVSLKRLPPNDCNHEKPA